MNELTTHAPADDGQHEQLPLEFEQPEAGTVDMAVPADATNEITSSPAYQHLVELRDAAYRQRRSGARAIAREAFAALRAKHITKAEHAALFTADAGDPEAARAPEFEELSEERPPHEFDHAERAAGEAVHRPEDEDN